MYLRVVKQRLTLPVQHLKRRERLAAAAAEDRGDVWMPLNVLKFTL
jgi:hypothetical protein